ncbi:MAG: copper chaperone PCu(A)C [Maricaulaceae bacterium]
MVRTSIGLAFGASLALIGCEAGDNAPADAPEPEASAARAAPETTPASVSETAQAPAAEAAITVENVRVRPALRPDAPAAIFLDIVNTGEADTLTAATSPAIERIELHTHVQEGDVFRMRPVESIAVAAEATTALEPQGLHLMAFGLQPEALVQGDLSLTLTFDTAGEVTIPAGDVVAAVADSAAEAVQEAAGDAADAVRNAAGDAVGAVRDAASGEAQGGGSH